MSIHALPESKQITVTLTFDDSNEDLDIREHFGVIGLPQHRIQRVCNEAYQQGGILSTGDIGLITLRNSSSISKISLDYEKGHSCILPHTGALHDMGTTVTHKSEIINKVIIL